MTWSDALASGAQSWAKYLAQNNLFKHASGLQVGENLYLSGSPLPEEPCTSATQAFYGEIKDYDFKKPGFSMDTGHFTQVNFFFELKDFMFCDWNNNGLNSPKK